MDYLEIMDFCGYDLAKADAMVRSLYDIEKNMEAIKRVDRMEPVTNWPEGRRLRRPRCSSGIGS